MLPSIIERIACSLSDDMFTIILVSNLVLVCQLLDNNNEGTIDCRMLQWPMAYEGVKLYSMTLLNSVLQRWRWQANLFLSVLRNEVIYSISFIFWQFVAFHKESFVYSCSFACSFHVEKLYFVSFYIVSYFETYHFHNFRMCSFLYSVILGNLHYIVLYFEF